MKKLILVVFIFLVSCGGNNNTSENAENTKLECSEKSIIRIYSNNLPIPTSISLKIVDDGSCLAMVGITVQLDDSGENSRTDANGNVSFVNLSGYHDVHVFSPEGYRWKSYYNINVDNGFFQYVQLYNYNALSTSRRDKNKSYINYTGAVQKSRTNTRIDFAFVSDKEPLYVSRTLNIPANNYQVQYVYSKAIATPVNTELWILEQAVNADTNTTQLLDAILIQPPLPVKTAEMNQNTIETDIVFDSLAIPKSTGLLMQLQSITVPTGLTVDQFSISGDLVSTFDPDVTGRISLFNADQLDLTQALSFSAYTAAFIFQDNMLGLIVGASKKRIGGPTWSYFTAYPLGASNIILKSKMTTIPVVLSNQPERVISWSVLEVPVQTQTVRINNLVPKQNGFYGWDIVVFENKNQITLPTFPSTVKSILVKATKYRIQIGGWLYDEISVNDYRVSESYSNDGTWIY